MDANQTSTDRFGCLPQSAEPSDTQNSNQQPYRPAPHPPVSLSPPPDRREKSDPSPFPNPSFFRLGFLITIKNRREEKTIATTDAPRFYWQQALSSSIGHRRHCPEVISTVASSDSSIPRYLLITRHPPRFTSSTRPLSRRGRCLARFRSQDPASRRRPAAAVSCMDPLRLWPFVPRPFSLTMRQRFHRYRVRTSNGTRPP